MRNLAALEESNEMPVLTFLCIELVLLLLLPLSIMLVKVETIDASKAFASICIYLRAIST